MKTTAETIQEFRDQKRLDDWSRTHFSGSLSDGDILPDPISNDLKVIAEVKKDRIILQRIETSRGQFVRVLDHTGRTLLLTKDL